MAGLPWYCIWTEFSRHGKTRDLCGRVKDRNAGMYIIRLFEHCSDQQLDGRVPAHVVEEVADWRGREGVLLAALEAAKILDVEGDVRIVHGWVERNGARIAKWLRDNAKPRGNKSASRHSPARDQQGTSAGPTRDQQGKREILEEDLSPITTGSEEDRSRDPVGRERDAASPPLDADAVLDLARREYRDIVGRPYTHASAKAERADHKAAASLLRAAAGDLEEIAVRWRTGLQNDRERGEWPQIRTLAELAHHWAEFGHTPAEAKAGLRRLRAEGG